MLTIIYYSSRVILLNGQTSYTGDIKYPNSTSLSNNGEKLVIHSFSGNRTITSLGDINFINGDTGVGDNVINGVAIVSLEQVRDKINSIMGSLSASSGGGVVNNITNTIPQTKFELLENAEDTETQYSYLDEGTPSERISTIVLSSASLGLTATKTYTYTGTAPNFTLATKIHS